MRTGDRPTRNVGGVPRRRRLWCFVAAAALAVSLAASSLAASGHRVSLQLGSTFTITGRTGSAPGKRLRARGKVVLSGRFGAGKWRVITTTTTETAGNYRFAFTPHRRGNITLRIAPPDHHLRWYLLRVY